MNEDGHIDQFAKIDDAEPRLALGGVADGFTPTTNSIWVVQYKNTVSRTELAFP